MAPILWLEAAGLPLTLARPETERPPRDPNVSTVITEECINCGACERECPNHAIYVGGQAWELGGKDYPALAEDIYYIAPEKCTECVGFFEREQCAVKCPVDCCVPDPNIPEREPELIERARRLHPDISFDGDFPSRFRT